MNQANHAILGFATSMKQAETLGSLLDASIALLCMRTANTIVWFRRQESLVSDPFYLLPVPMDQLSSTGAAGDGDGVMHLSELLSKV